MTDEEFNFTPRFGWGLSVSKSRFERLRNIAIMVGAWVFVPALLWIAVIGIIQYPLSSLLP